MNAEIEDRFQLIWNDLITSRNLIPQEKPLGVVLGGLPGSGKSILIKRMEAELNRNIIPINGDDFRIYHPNFQKIYQEHQGDYPKYTSDFSNPMVERVIKACIKNRFNMVIEGTFRDPKIPIKTLSELKNQGYETRAMIIATQKEIAWHSTIERYEHDLNNGFYARKVDKDTFDFIASHLARNTKSVLESQQATLLEIYSRTALLFHSQKHNPNDLEKIINDELNGLN